MPILIVDGSQMRCTLGSKPENISVSSQQFAKIDGQLIATENDKASIINIPSFGGCKCSRYRPPCVPAIQKWECISDKKTVEGCGKLTIDSFAICSRGGKISFVDSGKNRFVSAE